MALSQKERSARYRARNRERIREMRRAEYARDPERHRGYQRKYRSRNPRKSAEDSKRRREWIQSLKAGRPCSHCGITYPPAAMDWHHRDPSTKEFPVNNNAGGRGKEAILREIEKCDLLCANCHRVHHHGG